MKPFPELWKSYLRSGLAATTILFGLMSCATSPPIQSALPATAKPEPASGIAPQPTSFLPSRINTEAPIQPTGTPTDIIWNMIAQVDRERVLADLRKLTGEEPICNNDGCYTITNRLTGSEGLQLAKDYIYAELTRLGYTVEIQNWSLSGYTDQNIIARKPGATLPDEEVLFVAHLDGVKKDNIHPFPSADDNASGAVDILESARILSAYSFDRSVVLFFSTGEEEGTLGVQSYIKQLSSAQISAIKYVVNLDMVGYDADGDRVMQLWHGDHPPSMALTQTISGIISAYQINLAPEIVPGCG
jgi:hypothetical protein